MKIDVSIVVAVDEHNAIGRNGGLLCHLPNDLKHFKNITSGHTIIMGRNTYESLPNGALPNRINVVVTSRDSNNYSGCIVVKSIDEALNHCKEDSRCFIIGGGKLYESTIKLVNKIFLTTIHHTFDDADTFFPEIKLQDWDVTDVEHHDADEKHKYPYTFKTLIRK